MKKKPASTAKPTQERSAAETVAQPRSQEASSLSLHFLYRVTSNKIIVRVFSEEQGVRAFHRELPFQRFPTEKWNAVKRLLAKAGTVEPDTLPLS